MPGAAVGGGLKRVGGAAVLAAPTRRRFGSTIGSARQTSGPIATFPFRSQPMATTHVAIYGVTKDGAGTPIADCRVRLFRNQENVFMVLGGQANLVVFTARPVAPHREPPAISIGIQTTPTVIGELVDETISDASGNYIFYPWCGGPFWVLAVKADGTLIGVSGLDVQPEFIAGPPF